MAFAGSKIWNEIPKEIGMAQTLHSFKEYLNKNLATQPSTVIMTHWFTLLARVWGPLGGSCFEWQWISSVEWGSLH